LAHGSGVGSTCVLVKQEDEDVLDVPSLQIKAAR
jgi:hypothetical protein